MLRRHGNAVDAAIATALCQGIHNPQASGIGGGTFMLIRSPNGSVEVIDAREPAPAAATFDMYSGMRRATLSRAVKGAQLWQHRLQPGFCAVSRTAAGLVREL